MRVTLFLVTFMSLSGCGATAPTPSPLAVLSTPPSRDLGQKATSATIVGQNASLMNQNAGEGRGATDDLDRLARLWSQRTQEAGSAEYPLGPGDMLEISVPRMAELESRTVRVSGDGTIALPFVGVVTVQGHTESEVKDELRQRLFKYKRDPQVSLLVREYRSRLVAVAGAVAKPGLYSLTRTTDTLLGVISQAGGMTKEAFPQIILLPAEVRGTTRESLLVSPASRALQTGSAEPTFAATLKTDPLVIDLQRLRKGKEQLYLTLPVRPGDALIIPSGGDVIVGGWVDKPGAYKLTPGLTVLGVVTAAGDTLFPADTKAVQVIRTDATGEKNIMSANLQQIARGESADIPLQEGDVIEVNPSTVKLVSYGMFNFFRSVFTIGTQMRPF
jgi:polysaccharide biosynthesis/export protein